MRLLMGPQPPEATALLALMLLHDSRREARLDAAGDLVLLEEQDRRRWNQGQIAEALPLVEEALGGGPGPFALPAAIAARHCLAARAEDTDWPQIVRLYDLLERLQPSPIVSLNRAAAVAMVDGPRPALALIDALAATGELDRYHLAPSTVAMVPVPSPTTTPHSSASCHDAVIRVVRATPAATSASDVTMTRRMPSRSISPAANGPDRPKRKRFTETANDTVARVHPNSRSSGIMSTPGADRMPAVPERVRNVTATTPQP